MRTTLTWLGLPVIMGLLLAVTLPAMEVGAVTSGYQTVFAGAANCVQGRSTFNASGDNQGILWASVQARRKVAAAQDACARPFNQPQG